MRKELELVCLARGLYKAQLREVMEGQVSVYSKHKLIDNRRPLKTDGAGLKVVELPITRDLEVEAG